MKNIEQLKEYREVLKMNIDKKSEELFNLFVEYKEAYDEIDKLEAESND